MLKVRVMTALGLFPVALVILFVLPEFWFALSVGLVLLTGAWEWVRLSGLQQSSTTVTILLMVFSMILAASYTLNPILVPPILAVGSVFWISVFIIILKYPNTKKKVTGVSIKLVTGVLVLAPAFIALLFLRRHDAHVLLVALLFTTIWAADIGAYFVGRKFGRTKLAPHISPGKSWFGVFGGMIIALGISGLTVYGFGPDAEAIKQDAWIWLIPIVCSTVLFSVLGDLFESLIKRQHGVKDSSAILPGHGGILDRIDSLTAATPVFALWIYLTEWPML